MQIFIQNKYTTWYYQIVDNAKNRNTNNYDYLENHHIIPKSLGGDDCDSNLVSLTAREHYICHLLLMKMVLSNNHKTKMAYAFTLMRNHPKGGRINHARDFERFRKIAYRLQGLDHYLNQSCFIDGKKYRSKAEAQRKTGISYHCLTQMINLGYENSNEYFQMRNEIRKNIRFNKNRKVIIDGVEYPSINSAVKETVMTQYAVQQIEKSQRGIDTGSGTLSPRVSLPTDRK